MDYASLPSYPPPPSHAPEPQPGNERQLTPRQTQVLIDLTWLAGIMVLILWTRHAVTNIERAQAAERARAVAPPPTPLDFGLVAERFGQIQAGASREEVERLLGPPTERRAWGPEVEEFELRWWNGGKNIFRADREWNRWSDPANPNRWAAVVYWRWPEKEQAVYGKLKKGF
ncbi:hypothetical protein GobsT_66340 [Gemmata obscuriglobus]|nr:hypothetical protein [Gemmata obscuriglobus]QEG31790.1 hypothetical protein GobsT_66340 [Gemmata obscuriglobus]VTS11135.1 unnamed protein product [Gemmata obscuriglobus UQM 2246]